VNATAYTRSKRVHQLFFQLALGHVFRYVLQHCSQHENNSMNDKIRENRLRRMAERQGLKLRKSRRRDPHALGYGTYDLVQGSDDYVVSPEQLTLDGIEQWLTSDHPKPKPESKGLRK
jgi:hypothetical protein